MKKIGVSLFFKLKGHVSNNMIYIIHTYVLKYTYIQIYLCNCSFLRMFIYLTFYSFQYFFFFFLILYLFKFVWNNSECDCNSYKFVVIEFIEVYLHECASVCFYYLLLYLYRKISL